MGTVPLDIGNANYIEERYQAWRRDPDSVGPEWKAFFIGFDQGLEAGPAGAGSASRRPPPSAAMPSAAMPSAAMPPAAMPSAAMPSAAMPSAAMPSAASAPSMAGPAAGDGPALVSADLVYKQSRVDSLLWAYRDVGYLYARLNPLVSGFSPTHSYLQEQPRETYEQLTLEEFGLSEADLDTVFSAGRAMRPARAPLRDIIHAFRETYCGHVGVEFLHIQNKPIRRWLIERMESRRNRPDLPLAKKRIVLQDLIQAEELERFLHSTFIGQKRFSLEGSEAIIPALHFLVDSAHENGIEEIVLGTTHRGRLTILSRILNMPPEEIFSFFEGGYPPQMYGGSGDVKYHLGYSTDHVHPDGGSVHISLAANPSHLESVDPVVEGKARGAQRRRKDEPRRKRVVPVLLHGDAAFSGQGVVAETFNLSQLEGYTTGGTIHIVINNQIGFTTPARSYRSTFFSTDVAKMLPVPIFHVNGDDPEAVVYVARLALDFRQTFGQDVVIDVFGFRRYGHNEGDEPSFTHPKMYRIIEKHPGVATLYGRAGEQAGVMSREEQDRVREEFRRELKAALQAARRSPLEPRVQLHQREDWQGLKDGYSHEPVPTGVPEPLLAKIAERLATAPPGFHVHPKLLRILVGKLQALRGQGTVDWAFAEALGFGSLLLEGTAVRLSGQDAVRGTFAQRHLTWWDTRSPQPRPYTPLNHLQEGQATIEAFDSPLSEFSVLGFEYGFSLDQPLMLVIWEAQFGDFSNGAQVIIDNFIAAAEAKWHRHSGLVMLLPHGYEGQGPEHSSAHLERFLQLCADDNLQVCNATTPAQYFHLLRRQMRRDFRQPLIVMTPKSLLRHPMAVSPLSALAAGSFQEVLDDPGRPAEPRRLLFCSGKIYYDLVQQRERMRREGAARSPGDGRIGAAGEPAIVRLEQLHPFPRERLERLLGGYGTVRSIGWVQEEPQNRGAWSFIRGAFESRLGVDRLEYIGRPASPSPATGSFHRHQKEQEAVVAMALAGSPEERESIWRGRQDAHVA